MAGWLFWPLYDATTLVELQLLVAQHKEIYVLVRYAAALGWVGSFLLRSTVCSTPSQCGSLSPALLAAKGCCASRQAPIP